jgi:hypothetical protein
MGAPFKRPATYADLEVLPGYVVRQIIDGNQIRFEPIAVNSFAFDDLFPLERPISEPVA